MNTLQWLKTNINEIENGNYISTHLNDFFTHDNFLLNGNKLLCQVERQVLKSNLSCSEFKIELQFELLCVKNSMHGVPHSFFEFESRIDKVTPPEIIISKRKKGYLDFAPKIEYYMSPLPFMIEELNGLDYFYTEYRTIDELKENESFTSWFNIVIPDRADME